MEISLVDQGLQLYLDEVSSHIEEYYRELLELSEFSEMSNRDYRAAERLLQLLTEVAIGLSKHWLKSVKSKSSVNAYQTFVGLNELALINDDELKEWRKIIGLRNALVHDYLSIDKQVVKLIIKEKKFTKISLFCFNAIKALTSKIVNPDIL